MGHIRVGHFLENLRTRVPSLGHFLRRARADRRFISYDLLPVASTPAARDRLAGLLARLRPKTLNFIPSDSARRWHRALVEDGITPALPLLPAQAVADMRRYFETAPCSDPYRSHLGAFRWDAPASPDTNMGYFDIERILAAPHVLRLLNDPRVLETAELYLGCKPVLDNIGCWWSFGGRAVPKGTQRYHRDLDSLRGFKLFIYLTDVDEQSGPHMFVKGSHRDPRLDTGKAQTEATIREIFGAANEVRATGPAGTWFLADTFGFHRGALPVQGPRLILSAQYNINRTPHLPRRPVGPSPDVTLDPYVNRLILTRPVSSPRTTPVRQAG